MIEGQSCLQGLHVFKGQPRLSLRSTKDEPPGSSGRAIPVPENKREFHSGETHWFLRAQIATSPSAPRNDNVFLRVIASEAKQSRDNL